jgi:hypothetical protein
VIYIWFHYGFDMEMIKKCVQKKNYVKEEKNYPIHALMQKMRKFSFFNYDYERDDKKKMEIFYKNVLEIPILYANIIIIMCKKKRVKYSVARTPLMEATVVVFTIIMKVEKAKNYCLI